MYVIIFSQVIVVSNSGKKDLRAVKISLRTKILILVGGSLSIACSVLLTLALSMFKSDKRAYVFETSASLAGNAAQQIQMIFDGWDRAAIAISNELLDRENKASPTQIDWRRLHPDLREAYEIDGRLTDFKTVHVLCCDAEVGESAGMMKALWQRLNLAQALAINPTQVFKLFSEKNGEGVGVFVTTIGNASADNHRRLVLLFDLKSVWRIFSNVGGMEAILLDAGGQVVMGAGFAETDGSRPVIGDERAHQDAINSKFAKGAYETAFASGEQYIISYARVTLGRFLVLVRIPNSKAFSATDLLVNRSAATSGIIFSLVLAMCLLLIRTMTNEIAKLLSATQRVAKGQFNEEIQTKSHDEIGVLADSFNIMSKEIVRLLEATRHAARMEAELATAQLVQENFIPKDGLKFGDIRLSAHFRSATECGGDWWGHFECGDFVYVMIADATGHGVPAALITAAAHSCVATIKSVYTSPDQAPAPSQVLGMLNQAICASGKGAVKMTFHVLQIHAKNGSCKYANASHEAPLISRCADGQDVNTPRERDSIDCILQKPDATLGLGPDTVYTDHEMKIKRGDKIVLYTDGITECQNADGKDFGDAGLLRIFAKVAHQDVESICAAIVEKVDAYRGNVALADDMTLVCIEYA